MTDGNKPNGLVPTGDPNKPATASAKPMKIGLKTGLTGAAVPLNLRQRTAIASEVKQERIQTEQERAVLSSNRLALMLDISSSMSESAGGGYQHNTTSIGANDRTTKIIYLQRAYSKFIESVDYANTAIAVQTFPFTNVNEYEVEVMLVGGSHGVSLPLTTNPLTLAACLMGLTPGGGTPMADAMQHVIENVAVTRGILISDGDANVQSTVIDQARLYCEADVPVDCVHIGSSHGGERLLQQVAEITGGIYIKWKDVEAFSKALTYLTPRYRAMLTSGSVGALDIGASEVKYLGGK